MKESLSSSDNPQFEPPLDMQPPLGAEPIAPLPASDDPFVAAVVVPPLLPPRDPVWSGWDVLLLFVLSFVAMIVLQMLVLVGAMLFVYPRSTLAEMGQKPILLLVSQVLIYAAVATGMVMLVEGKYHVRFWPAVKWNWPQPQQTWLWLMLGVATLFVLALLQSVLPMPKDTPFEHLFDRPRDAYLLALMAVTLAPLLEELFFRGFMYPVVARRMGAAWGVILTALPFGLIHLPQYGWAWGAGLVIVLVGVVCGVVRARTSSVGASFLVHVGYNGAQMLIAIVATRGFQHMEKALIRF